ncbi:MAG: hypothetical protein IT371_10465 [Deltaproteobacteria bacterium]|nr:hypothetical protein [Deltaproteobacteria bacterium]
MRPVRFVRAIGIVGLVAGGCADTADPGYGQGRFGSSGLAIESSGGDDGVLRSGGALQIATGKDTLYRANAMHQVLVVNKDTGKEVARADLLTDTMGRLGLASVAHDLTEFDGVKERDTLQVKIHDLEAGKLVGSGEVPVLPTLHMIQGYGFQIDEVQPPHVYSAKPDGRPINAYVVGALPDNGETAAPVYAAGRGFPTGVTSVDLYLVKDQDVWKNKPIPQRGQEGWLAGPIVAKVENGIIKPTDLGWQPTGKNVGPYDIIVDVDRNGKFDHSFGHKDGVDGESEVGLTIQYSGAWFRAKSDSLTARGAADAAKVAAKAAADAADQAEAAAKNSPEAQAKAKAAREAATQAQAQAQAAETAALAAQKAFDQTLADAPTCRAEADKSETASKQAATLAKSAATDATLAAAAQKAYDEAVQARMTSSHLIVNLAYGSPGRGIIEGWDNTYTVSNPIFTYVNPPVGMAEGKHANVTKIVVAHQDWSKFWNNPQIVKPGGPGSVGRIYYKDKVVQYQGATVQNSCTNSPPVAIINPSTLPLDQVGLLKFDVVYDYGNDGYYDVGVDFLDVVAHRTDGMLVTGVELAKMPDDKIFGFQVRK